VQGVLDLIDGIRSTSAKATHYKALLQMDDLTQSEIDRIASDAGRSLASSPSDLRGVMDELLKHSSKRKPPGSMNRAMKESVQAAFDKATSSGDKASILTQYAASGDPEAVLMALRGAKESNMSSGDKRDLLKTLSAHALSGNNASLRRAFFNAVETVDSDGDKRDILMTAAPYGHANSEVTVEVIKGTRQIESSGDKAMVLILVARQRLLTSASVRNAYLDAAKLISSSSDYNRTLQAAVQQ
jgi:hypothetical protein